MRDELVRRGGLGVMAAGGLLIASEVIERSSGGFTETSFAVTIAAFAALAGAVWVVYAARPQLGPVALGGIAAYSVGSALQAVADVIGFGAASEEALQARTGPLVPIGAILMVVGMLAFGLQALRRGGYPRLPVLLMALTPLAMPLTAAGLPIWAVGLANMVFGAALLTLGRNIHQSHPPQASPHSEPVHAAPSPR